jgi:tetratricopeptide (TPR) repeat protein
MDPLAGTLVADRFRLERELGRGGMATVWLARDLPHERAVAIKILLPDLAGAIGVDRFIREVRLAARLQHPTIVPILDSGVLHPAEGPALPWYAMAYLEGESLRARLAREEQLPIDEALRITAAVGEALQAAHLHGIVHRDIKPDNIFLSGGQVYVIDFGIAKALLETGSEQLTSTGLAIGTPAYMSPEQASAGRVDARSDQYSLATVLYEMLAGEPPFRGPTAQAVLARRLAEPARPFRVVRPSVPESVERVILKALERVPADRYQDVSAFVAALACGQASGGRERRGRRRLELGLVLLAVAALTAAGWRILGPGRAAKALAPNAEVKALSDRGKRAYDRRTPGGTVEAIASYQAAIARDSSFTPAWAGLVDSYARALERGFVIPGQSRDSTLVLAVAAADRMLVSDSMSAAGWTAEAHIVRLVDPTNVDPSIRAARRALTIDSTLAEAWHYQALGLAEQGNFDAAMTAWRRGVRANPRYKQGLAFMSIAHFWRRSYDSAAVWADSALAVDANDFLARSSAGYAATERGDTVRSASEFDAALRLVNEVERANALAGSAQGEARAGRRQEARALLRAADSIGAAYAPLPLHTAVFVAQAHAALGEIDQALAWLDRYQPRRDLHFQLHLRCDPPFDSMAADPRFRALLIQPRPPAGQGC